MAIRQNNQAIRSKLKVRSPLVQSGSVRLANIGQTFLALILGASIAVLLFFLMGLLVALVESCTASICVYLSTL